MCIRDSLKAEILNYRNYVWNACDEGSEIANVSDRQSLWSIGRRPTSTGMRTSFHGVRHHFGQTHSDLCQELLGPDTHGSKCFQCHWKKVVGAAEWAVLFFLTAAVSVALALVTRLDASDLIWCDMNSAVMLAKVADENIGSVSWFYQSIFSGN